MPFVWKAFFLFDIKGNFELNECSPTSLHNQFLFSMKVIVANDQVLLQVGYSLNVEPHYWHTFVSGCILDNADFGY
ncbi:MAG: hypothetical protein JJE22_08265 [Bacteroidia bacterium]|nr:hypothetical protein [Bacteroidia bacterium]